MRSPGGIRSLGTAAILFGLSTTVFAANTLTSNGYSECLNNATIKATALDVTYDRDTRVVKFNVAGTSTIEQNVTANLVVTAYGRQVYQKSFSPCEQNMTEMCPVPAGDFSSRGTEEVPQKYADQIPSIAFSVPDLDGMVELKLTGETGEELACIQSSVGNGKTLEIPAVKYVAAGVAAAALALSAVSAVGAGASGAGASAPSPTFGEVFGWFQGMALNGMMSVKYPAVYQSFTSNFAFSTGLIPWGSMQTTIDNFRASTGGNLTAANYQYLQNATLVYANGKNSSAGLELKRRALELPYLFARQGTEVTVNGTTQDIHGSDNANSTAPSSTASDSKTQHYVKDIQAYVEQLQIPQANTFMTLLLVFAIIIAAIVVLILLFKVILEAWSLAKPLPKSLESWRKRYWWRLAKTITNLILLLYGVWTLYCIYQFTNGDSWAAKALAGVTLGTFTAILVAFTVKIWLMARRAKKMEGGVDKLYEDKETWVKYSLFYDNFKKGYWWLFIPVIIYLFVRGCVIAGLNGHGLIQSAAQLVVEAIMLALLLWTRPYSLKSSNWINIVIQVVRVLSVVCILIFVEELGISQTTKTIAGVALIVVQCALTGVLAILIAVNALIFCIKDNPHRLKRKAAQDARKLHRDQDDLTALDARNSLLMRPMAQHTRDEKGMNKAPIVSAVPTRSGGYDQVRADSPAGNSRYQGRSLTRPTQHYRDHSAEGLVTGAAGMGGRGHDRSVSRSPSRSREPQLPDLDFGFGRR
ncbi:hypothetical protein B0A48_03365 [Cryoendolithus antarcticus]|uniref:ML-like domain-containing protein n=1 Tax=Cryoendolithus antarcticus TaxID=1507870 RepID=A0A1V8TK72_9PEZI|nr:hypothetical protein B0A48_03365 [Cryoendolithus antarcticus]